MTNDTRQTSGVVTGGVPTAGERAEALLQEMETLLERLWRCQLWDEPEDLIDELTERVQKWLEGFDRLCYCDRPFRYCICP